LFVSDHYGIVAVVAVDDSADSIGPADLTASTAPTRWTAIDTTPTARTAVAWVPPVSTWDAIQEVRRRLDPQVLRWPPHVNFLFGFVTESEFDAAIPLLGKAATTVGAFTTELAEIRHFTHRTDSTLWLHPTGTAWQQLYSTLVEAFPACRSREAFTPHLTVGKVADPSRTPVKTAPISTDVAELAVLSRRGDGPMEVRAVIELGSGAVRLVDAAAAAPVALSSPDLDGPAAALTERITEALPEAAVHIVGSRRTGTQLPGADVDLVAAVPGTPDIDVLERRVATALGAGHRVRQLVAARVPGLRIVAPRLSVDLVLAPTGDIPPGEAVARRAELGETIASSLSAVSDAEAILALRPGPHVRVAKAWARARGLDAAPLGGLPGLAWTLMAARCRDLTDFFETWAAHDWHDPIPTPTAPIRDLTLHLTPAMRDLITEELYTTWETVTATSDPLPALLAPPPMHRRHRRWAVITLAGDSIEERDVLEGRVRGRMRSLLTALDEAGVSDAHAWPRPFQVSDTELRTAIGLGRTPPSRDDLAEIARPWLRGLGGVTVELAGNGDVPTLV
jgi:2'-5' RNA ligase